MSYKLQTFYGWVVNKKELNLPESIEEVGLSVVDLSFYEQVVQSIGAYVAVGVKSTSHHPADVVDLNQSVPEFIEKKLSEAIQALPKGSKFAKYIKQTPPKFFVYIQE